MSEIAIDASLALQWFLEDEADRGYSLAVLERLSEDRAVVPLLWFYEVGNGLTMACRRKRISYEQAAGYLARVRRLPVFADDVDAALIPTLPDVAAITISRTTMPRTLSSRFDETFLLRQPIRLSAALPGKPAYRWLKPIDNHRA